MLSVRAGETVWNLYLTTRVSAPERSVAGAAVDALPVVGVVVVDVGQVLG